MDSIRLWPLPVLFEVALAVTAAKQGATAGESVPVQIQAVDAAGRPVNGASAPAAAFVAASGSGSVDGSCGLESRGTAYLLPPMKALRLSILARAGGAAEEEEVRWR